MVETFNPTDLIADEIKPEIPEGYETSYELAEGYKEKIKDAGLVNEIPQDIKNRTKIKALEFAENEGVKWAGRKPSDLLDELAHTRYETLKAAGTKKEVIQNMVEKVRGFMGERASADIPLDAAETIYISIDQRIDEMKQLGKYQQKDVSERFGGTRKDLILAGLKLAPQIERLKFFEEIALSTNCTFEVAEKATKAATEVFLNYEKEREQYETETGFKQPQTEAIIFRKLKEQKELTPQEKAATRYIISWAYNASGRNLFTAKGREGLVNKLSTVLTDDKNGDNAEKAAKMYNESYHNITIPDAYVGEVGRIAGIVEVKTYTTKETDQWIKWLKQAEKESKETVFEKGPPGEVLIANGLQVTHHDIESGTTTFGPDIEAERNFARLNNGDQAIVPIIIRLPSNTRPDQMRDLYEIAKEKGITNFAIQRLPISINNIHKSAINVVEKVLIPEARKRKTSKLDLEILNELTKDKVWGFE